MYQKRRQRFMEKLPDNSIALFFSGKAPYKVGDEKYPFSVDRSYYWMTGLDKENMILLVGNIQGMTYEYLFIEPYDEELAKWVGGRILPEDASYISEIEEIYEVGDLWDTLSSIFSRMFNNMEKSMYMQTSQNRKLFKRTVKPFVFQKNFYNVIHISIC